MIHAIHVKLFYTLMHLLKNGNPVIRRNFLFEMCIRDSDDPALRANEQRKLNEMIRYCETDECLRQFILSYFGDNSPCTCEKCSN